MVTIIRTYKYECECSVKFQKTIKYVPIMFNSKIIIKKLTEHAL